MSTFTSVVCAGLAIVCFTTGVAYLITGLPLGAAVFLLGCGIAMAALAVAAWKAGKP